MVNESPWAKDLGYLERFIQKLEGQAANLPAERREQALALLAEERPRWATIMALLAGEPVRPLNAPVPASPEPNASSPVRHEAPSRSRYNGGLTVGSLIGAP